MFDLEEIKAELEKLQPGKPKISIIKENLSKAEKYGSLEDFMWLMQELFYQSGTYSDNFDFILNFPEYMAKIDSLEPQELEPYKIDFMHKLMGYIVGSEGYYQITKKTSEELKEEYKKRCKKYGFSLRTFYHVEILLCNDKEKQREMLELFKKEKRDDLSYGAFIEFMFELTLELQLGNLENAYVLEKFYNSGGIKSESEDKETELYRIAGMFSSYFNDIYEGKDKYEKMLPYLKTKFEYIKNEPYNIGICIVLHYCNADIEAGLEAWKVLINRIWDNREPKEKYNIFYESFYLFHSLELIGINEIEASDLDKKCPFKNENGKYITTDLKEWFYEQGMILAKKLDKKNGNTDLSNCIEENGCIVSTAVIKHNGLYEIAEEAKAEIKAGNIKRALELEKIADSKETRSRLREKGLTEAAIKKFMELVLYSFHYEIAKYYCENGEYEKVEPYADKIYNYSINNSGALDAFGDAVVHYTNSNLKTALSAWKKLFNMIWNQKKLSCFSEMFAVSYYLFKTLEAAGDEEISFASCSEEFPLFKKSGRYKTALLKDWFYEEALKKSTEIDEINKNNEEKEKLKKLVNMISPLAERG
jgi:hypothetical protein